MTVVGDNLLGATATPSDPSRLSLTQTKTTESGLTALMQVPAGAALGDTNITIQGPLGSQSLPITVVSSTDTITDVETTPIAANLPFPVYVHTPAGVTQEQATAQAFPICPYIE
jgi:hypothetical protein